MKHKILPILIGGLILGVISAIPFIGWLWFVWAILGGFLAVLLYKTFSKAQTAKPVEGVIIGLSAGVLGGVLMFVLSTIISFVITMMAVWSQRPGMTMMKAFGETIEYIVEKNMPMTIYGIIVTLVASVLAIAFATLGGFLGWLLFFRTSAAPQTVAPNSGVTPAANF